MKKILTSLLFLMIPDIVHGEEIAVISRYLPSETVTEKTIAKIFLKRKVLWGDIKKIIPVNLSPQNPLRILFSQKVLKKSHRELVEYWNEQHFKGINPPIVLESEEAVKIFVRQVDGAIGYIRSKNLEPDLRVLYTVEVE